MLRHEVSMNQTSADVLSLSDCQHAEVEENPLGITDPRGRGRTIQRHTVYTAWELRSRS